MEEMKNGEITNDKMEEEKMKTKKINLSLIFLIISLIVIIIMSVFIVKLIIEKKDENKKYTELENQIKTLSNLQVNTNNNTNTNNTNANTNTNNTTTNNNNSNNNQTNGVKYTFNTEVQGYVEITATKDETNVKGGFDIGALICNTGTMEIKGLGTVALVAYSGGESTGVNVYQLQNGQIKYLGIINCNMGMLKNVTYTVNKKDEGTAIITAKRDNDTITKEFEMGAGIIYTEVLDVFNYGKLVFVSETGGEYYAVQVYRLDADYVTGKTTGIIHAGTLLNNR